MNKSDLMEFLPLYESTSDEGTVQPDLYFRVPWRWYLNSKALNFFRRFGALKSLHFSHNMEDKDDEHIYLKVCFSDIQGTTAALFVLLDIPGIRVHKDVDQVYTGDETPFPVLNTDWTIAEVLLMFTDSELLSVLKRFDLKSQYRLAMAYPCLYNVFSDAAKATFLVLETAKLLWNVWSPDELNGLFNIIGRHVRCVEVFNDFSNEAMCAALKEHCMFLHTLIARRTSNYHKTLELLASPQIIRLDFEFCNLHFDKSLPMENVLFVNIEDCAIFATTQIRLPKLEALTIVRSQCKAGIEFIHLFILTSHKLEQLCLQDSDVGNSLPKNMLAMHCPNLRELDINFTANTNCHDLAKLRRLRILKIKFERAVDFRPNRMLGAFAKTGNLHTLIFDGFTPWSLTQFALLGRMRTLNTLKIDDNSTLTDAMLSKLTDLATLESLHIPNAAGITHTGLLELVDRCGMLSTLSITGCINVNVAFVHGLIELFKSRHHYRRVLYVKCSDTRIPLQPVPIDGVQVEIKPHKLHHKILDDQNTYAEVIYDFGP